MILEENFPFESRKISEEWVRWLKIFIRTSSDRDRIHNFFSIILYLCTVPYSVKKTHFKNRTQGISKAMYWYTHLGE